MVRGMRSKKRSRTSQTTLTFSHSRDGTASSAEGSTGNDDYNDELSRAVALSLQEHRHQQHVILSEIQSTRHEADNQCSDTGSANNDLSKNQADARHDSRDFPIEQSPGNNHSLGSSRRPSEKNYSDCAEPTVSLDIDYEQEKPSSKRKKRKRFTPRNSPATPTLSSGRVKKLCNIDIQAKAGRESSPPNAVRLNQEKSSGSFKSNTRAKSETPSSGDESVTIPIPTRRGTHRGTDKESQIGQPSKSMHSNTSLTPESQSHQFGKVTRTRSAMSELRGNHGLLVESVSGISQSEGCEKTSSLSEATEVEHGARMSQTERKRRHKRFLSTLYALYQIDPRHVNRTRAARAPTASKPWSRETTGERGSRCVLPKLADEAQSCSESHKTESASDPSLSDVPINKTEGLMSLPGSTPISIRNLVKIRRSASPPDPTKKDSVSLSKSRRTSPRIISHEDVLKQSETPETQKLKRKHLEVEIMIPVKTTSETVIGGKEAGDEGSVKSDSPLWENPEAVVSAEENTIASNPHAIYASPLFESPAKKRRVAGSGTLSEKDVANAAFPQGCEPEHAKATPEFSLQSSVEQTPEKGARTRNGTSNQNSRVDELEDDVDILILTTPGPTSSQKGGPDWQFGASASAGRQRPWLASERQSPAMQHARSSPVLASASSSGRVLSSSEASKEVNRIDTATKIGKPIPKVVSATSVFTPVQPADEFFDLGSTSGVKAATRFSFTPGISPSTTGVPRSERQRGKDLAQDIPQSDLKPRSFRDLFGMNNVEPHERIPMELGENLQEDVSESDSSKDDALDLTLDIIGKDSNDRTVPGKIDNTPGLGEQDSGFDKVACPICSKYFFADAVEEHASACNGNTPVSSPNRTLAITIESESDTPQPPCASKEEKKRRLSELSRKRRLQKRTPGGKTNMLEDSSEDSDLDPDDMPGPNILWYVNREEKRESQLQNGNGSGTVPDPRISSPGKRRKPDVRRNRQESWEQCFICDKMVLKENLQQHVEDDLDRQKGADNVQGPVDLSENTMPKENDIRKMQSMATGLSEDVGTDNPAWDGQVEQNIPYEWDGDYNDVRPPVSSLQHAGDNFIWAQQATLAEDDRSGFGNDEDDENLSPLEGFEHLADGEDVSGSLEMFHKQFDSKGKRVPRETPPKQTPAGRTGSGKKWRGKNSGWRGRGQWRGRGKTGSSSAGRNMNMRG
ncbi:uncharacterized protein SPPG_06536 [Spizellomyces punctatus DAOM BR117]|uniref:UBZ4-type domain-containing protein n=1 Tax=Spizellomyces punctatus (strain DAOM BR117) TaxID=645134 RepID=A0A0L0HB85_SPIPD|nr:uncharacterized protein SPPG_06536 [Spizellomyces punctatus DAOM BR117]KNC98129.1 hypothetical protein SPPG_06536 [Spizellomyces punctatus DAOM BR117]|eukprot:XP_016606169.1 hypothetical protein SPPG_06536 [Spizellomyces punctatus DAOM BR117]